MAQEATGGFQILFLKPNSNGRLARKATEQEIAAFEEGLAKNPNYKGEDIGVAKLVNDSTGAIVYHKQFSATDYGFINRVAVVSPVFNGKQTPHFTISIRSEATGIIEQVQFPIFMANGRMSQMSKNMIATLPQIDVNTKYSIGCYRKDGKMPDGKDVYNINLPINYRLEDDSREFLRSDIFVKSEKHPDGVIPPAKEVTKFGTKSKDYSDQDNFMYDLMVSQIARITNEIEVREGSNATGIHPAASAPKPNAGSQANVQQAAAPEPDPTDDLPF